jgi:hypothetical protein
VSDEAKAWGRIGGLTAWSRNDAEAMTSAAHRGFRRRFERIVDPGNVLDPVERTKRSDRARRAYMLTLAAKSAEARRRRAGHAVEPAPEAVFASEEP